MDVYIDIALTSMLALAPDVDVTAINACAQESNIGESDTERLHLDAQRPGSGADPPKAGTSHCNHLLGVVQLMNSSGRTVFITGLLEPASKMISVVTGASISWQSPSI